MQSCGECWRNQPSFLLTLKLMDVLPSPQMLVIIVSDYSIKERKHVERVK